MAEKQGRRWWKLWGVAVVVLAIVALLPTICARPVVLNWLLGLWVSPAQGSLRVASAELGWFSPLAADQIEIHDPHGEPIATVGRVSVSQSLWVLLRRPDTGVTIQVVEPELWVRQRNDSSNLEEFLAPYLSDDRDGEEVERGERDTGAPFAVTIQDGTVHIVETDTEVRLQRVQLARGAGATPAWQVELQAEVDGRPIQGTLQPEQAGYRGALRADAVSLAWCAPLIARQLPAAELVGTLSIDISGAWDGQDSGQLQGGIVASGLQFKAAPLGGDTLQLQEFNVPFQAAWQGPVAEAELQARCDLGHCSLLGEADLEQLFSQPAGATDWRQLAATAALTANGELDLVRLATLLPDTLNLRAGTRVDEGRVQFRLANDQEGAQKLWRASLETTALAAARNGQQFRWDDPLTVHLTARQTEESWALDSAECLSSFLQVQARGTTEGGSASVQCQLAELAERLGQFVDLSGVRLAGVGEGQSTWRRGPQGETTGEADFRFADLVLRVPERLELQSHGRLKAAYALSESQWRVNNVHVSAQSFRCQGAGLDIREPQLELVIPEARWDALARRYQAADMQFASTALAARLSDVTLQPGAQGAKELTGRVDFRGLLERLQGWLATTSPETARWQGQFEGFAVIGGSGDVWSAELDARGTPVALWASVASNAEPQLRWHEPNLRLRGRLKYELQRDRLEVAQLQLDGAHLRFEMDGSIDALQTTCQADLKATTDYDLARLSPLLQSYLGCRVELTGQDQATAHLVGPLRDMRQVQANLEAGWQAGSLFGLPVGPAKLSARLADGLLRVAPLSTTLAAGRLTVEPAVRLAPAPQQLSWGAGQVLQNVELQPQICEEWLKYVAPVFAGATQLQGSFSLYMDEGSLPLSDPRLTTAAGKLRIHTAEVAPGPLSQQYVVWAKQIEAVVGGKRLPTRHDAADTVWLRLRDQQVDFAVHQGRVFHRGLEFQSGNVVIRTRGSVGLDETLDLVAEVPFQEAWVSENALLANLRSQPLEIRIAGTFRQPQIDAGSINRLASRLLQDAAQGAIQRELGNQLQKLFQ